MPNSPGGKVNAANLNIEGLNPEPAVVGTDVVILGRTGQANRSATVSQLGGGGGRKEDAIYNPSPPEHAARCLEDVMVWIRNKTLIELGDAGMGMSLPVRMAIGHAHFEAVHPFSNGNGRVGRILWPLQMAAAGHLPLYLSGYVERNNHEYGQALQEAQKQLCLWPHRPIRGERHYRLARRRKDGQGCNRQPSQPVARAGAVPQGFIGGASTGDHYQDAHYHRQDSVRGTGRILSSGLERLERTRKQACHPRANRPRP